MLLKTHLRWGVPFAAALCAVLVAAWREPKPGQVLQAQLFKQVGEQGSVELLRGDVLAPGDELYMTVEARRALHVYVVSEDAAGVRLIIYPCQNWGRSPQLGADQPHRLPGREGFWPVRSVTLRERLLVIAGVHPIALLDAAFLAAENPEPCLASVSDEANRWIDGLVNPSGGPLWNFWYQKPETWISTFDLKGVESHG
jgi:hypothetical protein